MPASEQQKHQTAINKPALCTLHTRLEDACLVFPCLGLHWPFPWFCVMVCCAQPQPRRLYEVPYRMSPSCIERHTLKAKHTPTFTAVCIDKQHAVAFCMSVGFLGAKCWLLTAELLRLFVCIHCCVCTAAVWALLQPLKYWPTPEHTSKSLYTTGP